MLRASLRDEVQGASRTATTLVISAFEYGLAGRRRRALIPATQPSGGVGTPDSSSSADPEHCEEAEHGDVARTEGANGQKRQRRPVSRVLSPGVSPGDGHFSRAPVARRLQRPDPGAERATPLLPYSALLRVGFTEPARSPALLVSSYLTVSPLPPSHLLEGDGGGLLSVALVRGVSPPGRYPAPCPAEPGLSSRRVTRPATIRPSLALAQYTPRGLNGRLVIRRGPAWRSRHARAHPLGR